VTGLEIIIENFLPEVRKMFPQRRGKHFTNRGQKIFNNNR